MLYQLTLPTPSPRWPALLTDGLALHLQHAPLTSLLVQRGGQGTAFLALGGCGACPTERCSLTCPAELLRCTLRAAWGPGVRLRPLPDGLLPVPYTRLVLATPTPDAQPLTGDLLQPYAEARLLSHAHQGRLGALLAVGADGPDPATVVRARGWQVWPIPPWATAWARAWWAGRGVRAVPTRPTRLPPALLLPGAPEMEVPPLTVTLPPALAALTTGRDAPEVAVTVDADLLAATTRRVQALIGERE
jgi:hypothetical protein